MAEATINISVKTDNSGVNSLKEKLNEAIKLAQSLAQTPGPELDKAIADAQSLQKEFNKVNSSIESVTKSIINVDDSVVSLKQAFREANIEVQKLANAEIVDQKALNEAILRAADLKDRMNDVNEQVAVLTAGSKFEALGNQLGDIGGKILSLDFEGANESAQRLVKLTKAITLGDAVKGVKDLGSTFLNLGKALLTNPLFLIATAIALAVTAVVKLLDKMGLLKKIGEVVGWIFEKIGEFIEYIADQTSIVIDAIFGTTLVAEKQAQKLAGEQDKLLEKTKARSQAVTEASDREIKEQKALGKNTETLERKKLQLIINTAQVEFDLYNQRINNRLLLKGLDEEEIKALKEKFKESKKALQDAKSDLKVFNNEQQTEKENAIKKDSETSKAAAEKARLARKQFNADRLAAERQFEDLRLANLPEGVEKELALNTEKYKRLIEDTNKNEKLLATEKVKIIAELGTQQTAAEEKIKNDDNNRKLEKEKEFQQAVLAVTRTLNQTRTDLLNESYDKDIEALNEKLAKEELTLEQFNAIKTQIDNNYREDKEAIDKEFNDRETAAKLELNAIDLAGKLDKLEAERKLELEQKELTESEKLLIDKKYSDLKNELIEAERQSKIKAAQDDIAIAKQGLDSIQDLTDAVFAAKLAKVEKGSKEEEKLARKQFQFNKALQLGGAIIDASKAVLSSLAQSPIAIGPVPNPAGIASLAFVAASSIANIAKISSAKFGGTGGGAPPASTPPSVSTPSTPAAQPQFNLFGGGNNANTIGPGSGNEPTTQAININSNVSVTEINSTQNKVKVIEDRSSL